MGQNQSTADDPVERDPEGKVEKEEANNPEEKEVLPPKVADPKMNAELFSYVQTSPESSLWEWSLISQNAFPRFFNANEDSKTKKAEWILEIEAGDIETRADNNLNYVVNVKERRVSFYANKVVWALRFPRRSSFTSFITKLRDFVFFNEYGFENSTEKKIEKLGEDAIFFYDTSDIDMVNMDQEAESLAESNGAGVEGKGQIGGLSSQKKVELGPTPRGTNATRCPTSAQAKAAAAAAAAARRGEEAGSMFAPTATNAASSSKYYNFSKRTESMAKSSGSKEGLFSAKDSEGTSRQSGGREDRVVKEKSEKGKGKREEKGREANEADEQGEEFYRSIIIGAGANNYVLQGSHFRVINNLPSGGVVDAETSFSFKSPFLPNNATSATAAAVSSSPSFSSSSARINPSRALLASCEAAMSLLSLQDPTLLHRADVAAEKVVRTFVFKKDDVAVPIVDIAHDHKAAQLEARSTFLGLDRNRICRWDARDPKGVVQVGGGGGGVEEESMGGGSGRSGRSGRSGGKKQDLDAPSSRVSPPLQSSPWHPPSSPALHRDPVVAEYLGGKDYARGTNFSCMATTGDGCVVIGSLDGKLRLYNSSNFQRAMTVIPSLGAPITAVDVTFDGEWVLGTTDYFLLIASTTYGGEEGGDDDDSNNNLNDDRGNKKAATKKNLSKTKKNKGASAKKNGFTSQMGGKGSPPRLLRLSPEDAAAAGPGARFSRAKFTWVTEAGQKEEYIVASYGHFTVVWSLDSVRQTQGGIKGVGGLSINLSYTLSSKQERVVDAAFLYDRERRREEEEEEEREEGEEEEREEGEKSGGLLIATAKNIFSVI